MATKARRVLEKWFCPLCSTRYGAHTKICERCRCTSCGRPMTRDPHHCERDEK